MMSRLKELTEYKNTIITRILESQNILKAVHYRNSDFLDKENIEDYDKVLFSNIYPFNYIPTTEEELKEKKIYITISVTDYRKAGSVHFNAGNIFIYTFMHKDLFRTDYGFLRTDYIISEIHDLMDQKRDIGMGKLEFVGMKEVGINNDYQGAVLQYRPVDRN